MAPIIPLMLALAMTVLFPQTPPADLITGSWLNDNTQGGITQVVVRQEKGRTLVHAWGSCTPSDCDWGETAAEQWNGTMLASWDHGFAIARMQLVPQPDGRLLVVHRTEFRDGSGRTDNGSANFFSREKARSESPETVKARELVRRVAEAYRNLPASRFEFTETVLRTSEQTERRSQARVTVLFSPPNKWRRETTGGREPETEIADGKTRWTVYPQTNEYRSTGQGAAVQPLNYASIDQGRNPPAIVGTEQVNGVECMVVRLDLGREVTEDLWIDNVTHLVRKDLTNEPGGRRELVFSVVHLGERFLPDVFTYAPESSRAVNRTQASRQAPETMVGKPAPDIALSDLAGREVRLADLRGKVVLLDFWATWCGYCREALPMIEMYHRGLGSKGLVVFGVDDEAAETARAYLQRFGYTLPSLVDANGEAVRRFRVEGWPTTVLIDRDGKVVFYASGAGPEQLRDAIRSAGVW